jgi:4-amino-4-deoxy-L-arabinose transferase-like glycosyltransferase
MQLWFLTVSVLAVMEYYVVRDKWWLLVLAGVSLAGEVLTYPTCVILFPFFLSYLLCKSGKNKWRDILILTGTCALCSGIWLLLVFRNVSLEEFLRNVKVSFPLILPIMCQA